MSSVHGKNSLSFRKKRTGEYGSASPIILQDYKFAHEAAAGETFIDLDALVTPTSVNTGVINPVGAQLAALNLKNNSNSIIVISSHKGTLQQGSWQVSNSGRRINLGFATQPNEVFTVQVRATQATANVVDADAFAITGTLVAGETDIPLGQVFTLNANPTEQIGEVILTIDGVEQLRNVNNATADPLADGNYQEVESGSNQMNLLRMNEPFPVDVAYSVKANGLIVNAEPNNSVTQKLESLGGQLDAIIPTVADLAGVDESEFQGAPNSVDLKAFSDKVYANTAAIESNDADIANLQAYIDAQIAAAKKPPAAKITNSVSQSIPNANGTYKEFDYYEYNTQPGLVELSSNGFRIQENGIYQVDFACGFGNSGDYEKTLLIYVNGVAAFRNNGAGDGQRTDGRFTLQLGAPLLLNTGDLVQFVVVQYSGSAAASTVNKDLYASILKISDI